MFDIWHAADKYLTKYNVTYSSRWGSLLFAVRNGDDTYHRPDEMRHMNHPTRKEGHGNSHGYDFRKHGMWGKR